MILEDSDGDGFDAPDDCDDGNAGVHPGADETPYDGVDQDCDGVDLTDADGDGHDAEVAGGDDCEDDNDRVGPDQEEICGNVRDDNCDGIVDERCDGSGVFDPGGMWWTCATAPVSPVGAWLVLLVVVLVGRRRA